MRDDEQARKTIARLKRIEYAKTILLSLALVVVVYIIVTRSAEGSQSYGVKNAYVTGDVYVTGNIVYNGSIGAYPKGSILMFKASCPTGWGRYTVMDNKIPQFSSTPNGTGDTSAHTHTYTHDHTGSGSSDTDGGAHTHTSSWSTTGDGYHLHTSCTTTSLPGCPGYYGFWEDNGDGTSQSGSHSHSWSDTSGSVSDSASHTISGTSGTNNPGLSSNSTLPASIRTVFCKKS